MLTVSILLQVKQEVMEVIAIVMIDTSLLKHHKALIITSILSNLVEVERSTEIAIVMQQAHRVAKKKEAIMVVGR